MKTVREWMRDRRVAGLLGGVAILLVGYRLYPTAARTHAPKETPSVSAEKEADPGKILPGATDPDPAVRTPARPRNPIRWSWDRNPFLPSEAPPSSAGRGASASRDREREPRGLADLRGTVITRDTGIAIFGNRLVPAGGTIDGWTVVKVDPYAVSLRRGGESRTVEMFKPAP